MTSLDLQVWYEAVELGQPDVKQYNDEGELVAVDTRADSFLIRVSDSQFLPPDVRAPLFLSPHPSPALAEADAAARGPRSAPRCRQRREADGRRTGCS